MNKKYLIEKLLTEFQKQAGELKIGFESACQSAIDAPGAMQSKSDTTKSQMSRLADNILFSYQQVQNCISSIKERGFHKQCEEVEIGAVVQVEENQNENYYFILPTNCGGQHIELEGEKISAISDKSPVAQALLNKKIGDVIKIKVPAGLRTLIIKNIK